MKAGGHFRLATLLIFFSIHGAAVKADEQSRYSKNFLRCADYFKTLTKSELELYSLQFFAQEVPSATGFPRALMLSSVMPVLSEINSSTQTYLFLSGTDAAFEITTNYYEGTEREVTRRNPQAVLYTDISPMPVIRGIAAIRGSSRNTKLDASVIVGKYRSKITRLVRAVRAHCNNLR